MEIPICSPCRASASRGALLPECPTLRRELREALSRRWPKLEGDTLCALAPAQRVDVETPLPGGRGVQFVRRAGGRRDPVDWPGAAGHLPRRRRRDERQRAAPAAVGGGRR